MITNKNIIIIGNSDGIGLNLTKKLLNNNNKIIGISRSNVDIKNEHYTHFCQNILNEEAFTSTLLQSLSLLKTIDLCIYCAGIGNNMDINNLEHQVTTFKVNSLGAVISTTIVIEEMLKNKKGHFIGLSSVADAVLSTEAPSYCASKSGISKYWESMGFALKPKNIHISNIRFGFEDTKMAKAKTKPFLISSDKATNYIIDVIKKPRIRFTRPLITGLAVRILQLVNEIKITYK